MLRFNNYYVTFGQKFRREIHPANDFLHPDGWIRVVMTNPEAARFMANAKLAPWANLYSEEEFLKEQDRYPKGELGVEYDPEMPEEDRKALEKERKTKDSPWYRKTAKNKPKTPTLNPKDETGSKIQ